MNAYHGSGNRIPPLRTARAFADGEFLVRRGTGDIVRAFFRDRLVLCPRTPSSSRALAILTDERNDTAEFVPVVVRPVGDPWNNPVNASTPCGCWWSARTPGTSRNMRRYENRTAAPHPGDQLVWPDRGHHRQRYFEGDASELPPNAATPIGKPFPNTQMYVLDQRLRTASRRRVGRTVTSVGRALPWVT